MNVEHMACLPPEIMDCVWDCLVQEATNAQNSCNFVAPMACVVNCTRVSNAWYAGTHQSLYKGLVHKSRTLEGQTVELFAGDTQQLVKQQRLRFCRFLHQLGHNLCPTPRGDLVPVSDCVTTCVFHIKSQRQPSRCLLTITYPLEVKAKGGRRCRFVVMFAATLKADKGTTVEDWLRFVNLVCP